MDIERMQKVTTRSIPTTPTEDVTTMSSNATTVTVDKTEYDALLAASHNSRNGGRNRAASPYQPRVEFQGRLQQSSYSRTDRSRSRDRGRDRPSEYQSSSNQSRYDRPERYQDRSRSRDRSTGRGRSTGTPQYGLDSYYGNRSSRGRSPPRGRDRR